MYTVKGLALNVLKITGDDELSQYRRAVHAYAFSIGLLFPPPAGGLNNIKSSAILSAAKKIAALRLFDHKIFKLDAACKIDERVVNGIKTSRRSLQSKIAFQDKTVRSLFVIDLFSQKHGLSSILDVMDFSIVEDQISKRTEEMDTLADLINIYILCVPEIKRRHRFNGIDIVIRLYLDSIEATTGDRTLANNWRQLKSTAIFHYLFKYQDRSHSIFSPPSIKMSDFGNSIISMSELNGISELIEAHDYVAAKLNVDFELDLPVVRTPPPTLELLDNLEYRHKLLKLLV